MTICLRRFEAEVLTFPHNSHWKLVCQSFVPFDFERRVTQCSNVWQNEARNRGFHLKHNQRAWVLVSELTFIQMGFSPPLYFSPLWKSSWVFKALVLVKCLSQHLQCLHCLGLPPAWAFICIFKLFPLENALAHSSHAESLSSLWLGMMVACNAFPEKWKWCRCNSSKQHGWWIGKSFGRQR